MLLREFAGSTHAMKTLPSPVFSRYTVASGRVSQMTLQKPRSVPDLRKPNLRGEDPCSELVGDCRRLSSLGWRASWSTSSSPRSSVLIKREKRIRKGDPAPSTKKWVIIHCISVVVIGYGNLQRMSQLPCFALYTGPNRANRLTCRRRLSQNVSGRCFVRGA